ncbi:MAG: PAS domain-containing protein, partial [Sulfitobacter sp.]
MADLDFFELLAALPWPAVMIDADGQITAANSDAQDVIGKNIVGRNFMTMIRQPALLGAIETALSEGTSQEVAYLVNNGGQGASYRVTVRMLRDLNAVMVCFIDRTEMEQAGQMRRDFVANVSHELR